MLRGAEDEPCFFEAGTVGLCVEPFADAAFGDFPEEVEAASRRWLREACDALAGSAI